MSTAQNNVVRFPAETRREARVSSWKWNELEEDVLDELPHACQIIYLRVMRKHMDYGTGIVGRTRRISYEQIKERLRYTPPPQSRDKAVEYSTDQVKKLIRKLVDAGLLERLHDTSHGVQPMEFRLPLASTDTDSQGHDRATGTGPRENPHGRASGEDNRATTEPRENAPQGHPSGSGNKPSLPKGKESSGKAKPKPVRAKKFEPGDMDLAERLAGHVDSLAGEPGKRSLETWANEIRLMRERDGHTSEQIRWLMDWAAADSFWQRNILSPSKLREKWQQLVIQAKAQHKPKASSGRHTGLQAPSTDGLIDKGDGTYEF